MSADSAHDIDCANFFDHIQDLLDFQEDKNVFIGGRRDKFPGAWDGGNGCSPDLAAELLVPYEDVVQMEWLSTFVEDSFYGGNSSTLGKQQFSVTKDVAVAEAVGPVSVLESSSSNGNSNNGGLKVMPLGRVRSKRPRPPTFNPGSAMQLISPAHSFTDTPPASVSDEGGSFNESPRMAAGSNKKRKVNQSFSAAETSTDPRAGVRKCLHCEITKTPQWRAGPMGPKTLCNACGVRHKSGRLFPEYRPAASPTFAPSLHSNSHKKVLEMRTTSADIPTTLTPEDNSF